MARLVRLFFKTLLVLIPLGVGAALLLDAVTD